MRSLRFILAMMALLVCSPLPSFAADQVSAAAQLKELKADYDAAVQKFQKAYAEAKTDAEREKISVPYPQPDAYADRFIAIADKAPKSDIEREAMIWIVQKTYYSPKAEKAIERLQANHVKSADLGPALQMLGYSQAKNATDFLKAIIRDNPHKSLQAQATYTLGYLLNSRDGEKNRAEVEKLFETVRSDFKDVEPELVKRAESELYEIRNLAIGQVAPEIKGADVDGKQFALSEYRGRVVVLDFWGDW